MADRRMFKTAKHRFAYTVSVKVLYLAFIAGSSFLYCLPNGPLDLLSNSAFLLPDWGKAANCTRINISSNCRVLLDIKRLIPLARSCGFDIHFSSVRYE